MSQEKHFGYMVDISGLQFADGANGAPSSWIQAAPLGSYTHPFFGEIDFTPEKLKQFVLNVKNNVRDTELDIDYDHKMTTGEAAGWVKDAEYRENEGLWILVEWTKTAAEKIKEKAYKYFSPEFAEKWKHPKTGAIFENVLFGGGITNRPFLKDILPLNLSELVQESGSPMVFNMFTDNTAKTLTINADGTQTISDTSTNPTITSGTITATQITSGTIGSPQPAHQGGGKKMAAKKFSELSLSEIQALAKTLGLSEDAPVSEVEKTLNELVGTTTPPAPPAQPPAQPAGAGGSGGTEDTRSDLIKRLSETGHLDEATLANISALVSDNPANKVLAEVIEEQQIQLAQTTQSLALAEANARITRLAETAIQKKFAFPSAVQEDLRELFTEMPKKYSDRVYGLMEKLAKTGLVQLGELSRVRRGDVTNQSAGLQLTERANALMAQNPNMSFADAVEQVARDNRGTFDDYRADVMELD